MSIDGHQCNVSVCGNVRATCSTVARYSILWFAEFYFSSRAPSYTVHCCVHFGSPGLHRVQVCQGRMMTLLTESSSGVNT